MAITIARFTCPSSYLFVVCFHSRLGETGHLPCGFDTRFLSLRHFPEAQVVGRVADPDLEGEQVAVLRLHAAPVGHVTKVAYSRMEGMYVRYGTKHKSEDHESAELLRTPYLRTSENSV